MRRHIKMKNEIRYSPRAILLTSGSTELYIGREHWSKLELAINQARQGASGVSQIIVTKDNELAEKEEDLAENFLHSKCQSECKLCSTHIKLDCEYGRPRLHRPYQGVLRQQNRRQ